MRNGGPERLRAGEGRRPPCWPGPGGCSFVWDVGGGAWMGLWGPRQVSCPQQHPCPTLAALGVEGMQGHSSPSPDPHTPEPLSLHREGWKPTVTGVEPGRAPGDRGRGLVGVQAYACCCAFPSRRASPGPSPRRAAPQTRMPAQLGALQRLLGGHGKPLPDAPGQGGGGAGQPARLGRSCAGFPGLGTPPPRPHSWACRADRSGGSGQLRTGVGPPSSHPRSSFSLPASSPRPPSAFLGEQAQLRP